VKLVVFTPAVKTSAIGRMATLVVQALAAQGHQVVVVRTEDISHLEAPIHAFGVEVVRWDDTNRVGALTRTADLVVYQIGNSFQFHRGCLEWLPTLPGVVCLHDYFLGGLFWSWATPANRVLAQAILQAWYGEAIAANFFNHRCSKDFIEATWNKAPMTEWIASMATGVITHSSWDIERIVNSCPGPVEVVPLAYDQIPASMLAGGLNLSHKAKDSSGEFTILTIGHINPNKRAESVIRALGNSATLRRKALYRLVGAIEQDVAAQLSTLAENLGVRLSISDEVEDAVLLRVIEEADILCCLRLPALEAASASAIEAMLHGKPTVVMDTGFYRELPDDCVRKISPDHEASDLQTALEFLYQHPLERSALGQRAAQWATVTFSATQYAERLTNLALRATQAMPAIEAVRFFAGTLKRWGASEEKLSMQDTVAPLQIFEAQ